MGPEVKLIDPGVEVAAEVKKEIEKAGMMKDFTKPSVYHYVVSGSPTRFQELGSKLLGRPVMGVRQESL